MCLRNLHIYELNNIYMIQYSLFSFMHKQNTIIIWACLMDHWAHRPKWVHPHNQFSRHSFCKLFLWHLSPRATQPFSYANWWRVTSAACFNCNDGKIINWLHNSFSKLNPLFHYLMPNHDSIITDLELIAKPKIINSTL